MSLRGVLSEIEDLSLDDTCEDKFELFCEEFSKRYAVTVSTPEQIFKYIDSLKAKRTRSVGSSGNVGAQEAFLQVEALLESQIEETRLLAVQRNKLVEQLHKLDEVCRQSDAVGQMKENEIAKLQQKMKEPVIVKVQEKPEPKKEEPIQSDAYRLLASVYRNLSDVNNNSFQDEIAKLKEDCAKTAGERLVAMARKSSEFLGKAYSQLEQLETENKHLQARCEDGKRECCDVLNVLEEEVEFIRKLAFSKDLQNLVLYRTPGQKVRFDAEKREELARRCASIGSFIDEKVGKLEEESIERKLDGTGISDYIGVFELMHPAESQHKIAKIMKEVESCEDVSTRKLVDILAGQVLMNEILKSHATVLSERVLETSRCNHRLETMRSEKDELQKQVAQLTTENEKLAKKEVHVKKKLAKLLKATNGEDPGVVIKGLKKEIKHIKEEARQKLIEMEELMREQQHCTVDDPTTVIIEPSGEQVEMIPLLRHTELIEEAKKDLVNEIGSLKEQLELVTDEFDALKSENESLQTANKAHLASIETMTNEQNESQKRIDEEKKAHKREIEDLQDRIHDMSREMKQTQAKLEEDLKLSEERNQALSNDKANLKSRIRQLEEVNIKGIESIKAKSADLRQQYSMTIKKMEKLKASNSELKNELKERESEIAKSRGEVDELNLNIKSLQLKMKAADEKANLEKQALMSQISATKTSAQSDFDRLEKEAAAKIREREEKELQLIREFVHDDVPEDVFDAIQLIGTQLVDLRKVQNVYSAMINDISATQQALDLQPHEPVSKRVAELLKQIVHLEQAISRTEGIVAQREKEAASAAKEISRLKSLSAAAKQWETWGRRILKVVRNARTSDLDGTEIRLALEESLLSSVSNRVMFARLETLRSEKQLLMKYNRRTFMGKSDNVPQWSSVLVSVIALLRLHKAVGGTPAASAEEN